MESEDLLEAECRKRVGRELGGKWHIDRLVGFGGMAAVYAATHRNGRNAALKLLHANYAAMPQVRERFLREAYIANKIHHPGVVRIEDDDATAEGVPFLVMELLEGESLEHTVARRGGKLPVGEVMRLVERVLDIVEEAHAAGIVHRDLKPENLFMTRDGQVKVLDFGIARLLEGTEGTTRTREGLVMGTPAFMAPEQALGRWSAVDARTDLWAIGAIAFSLISGRMVHEAPSGNETLVLAASRPAPSLARVSDAPIAVVRCIDRALSYDMAKRFDDAATMHGDVLRVLAELGKSSLPPGPAALAPSRPAPALAAPSIPALEVKPPRSAPPPSAAPPERPPTLEPPRQGRERPDEDLLDDVFPGTGDFTAASEAFRQVEHALFTRQQYGTAHPETSRALERAFKACERALEASEDALVWQVTPYAFAIGGEVVWEPRAPFDTIPYQLFADGVRVLGFVSGVRSAEVAELLRIITLDRIRDVSPDEDFVTLLWGAAFEHVVFRAVDTFAEGELSSRAAFARAAGEVTALLGFDTSFQLEECWQDAKGGLGGERAAEREARIRQLLAQSDTRDREALVRAESFKGEASGGGAKDAVALEPATLELVRARLGDASRAEPRLVGVLSEAFRAGRRVGLSGAVTVPLRATLDDLAQASPPAAIRFLTALLASFEDRHAPGEAAELRATLTREAISERLLGALLASATGAQAPLPAVELVRDVLAVSGADFVPKIVEVLAKGNAPGLANALSDYLAKNGEGHEEAIAAAFTQVDLDTGLALVRVLGRIGSAAAKQAVLRAAESPHAVLRIEALSHLDAAGERLRVELRALLEDPIPEVRLSALRAIRERLIRAAGPALTMRVKAPGFDKLPVEERRQILVTLAVLAPARAEAVCTELLGDARLLTIQAHEESRAIAAEVLGQIASTRESLEALADASTGRFRYSDRVRTSATVARETAVQRLSQRPPVAGPTSRPAPHPSQVPPADSPTSRRKP